MYWIEPLPSPVIAPNPSIPLKSVAEAREKAQQNTNSTLLLGPEAFLKMVTIMSDTDLMNYIKQQDLEEIKNMVDQAHYYLIRLWKDGDRENWRKNGNDLKHFMANCLTWQMTGYVLRNDYTSIVKVLRFIGILSAYKDISSLFSDSENRIARVDYNAAEWLQTHKERFWIK